MRDSKMYIPKVRMQAKRSIRIDKYYYFRPADIAKFASSSHVRPYVAIPTPTFVTYTQDHPSFVVHPPLPPPPLPHEAMEVHDGPTHGDEDHASAPAIERSSNRKDVLEEISRHFDVQGRTFHTQHSNSQRVAYKCDGCNLKFALNLCMKKGSLDFGTWGFTKKAAQQSWKVRPFPLRLLRLAFTTSCNHRRLCITARRVMRSTKASDEGNAFGKRRHLCFDQVFPKQGTSEEEC